ncbi:MAG: GMC oxidoreductase [Chloroflexota bacterium]
MTIARATTIRGGDDGHFDAIVVGSGFGGSVMTYRLREAGLRVCLLERGRVYPPGSFPRSPYRFQRAFWDPSDGLYGMYNVWSFRHFDALVSSGLGGGSLIYANVTLRKDPSWFVREDLQHGGYEYWPVTAEDLEEHYDRAERMLNAQEYPIRHTPYDKTPRTVAFMHTARQLGWQPMSPKLAVTFANDGEAPVPGEPIREEHPNLHGRTRQTCRLVGECDIGCNYGSKNSLDYNYLSAAVRLGADIRTLCEVRTFRRRDSGGWAVQYVRHDPEREGRRTATRSLPLEEITADRLVISAGTFGSTYLLLRNVQGLPALGTHFSGNGDLLTLAVRPTTTRNGKRVPVLIDGGYGPVITSAVRFEDEVDGGDGRGFYLEDIGYPEFVNWMMQVAESPRALWRWRHIAWQLIRQLVGFERDRETDIGAELSAFMGGADLSAGVLPLAGMGRDVPDGVLKLSRRGMLDADWTIDHSDAYFSRVRSVMQRFAGAMGAEFHDNPVWHFGRRVMTAHPLGGCPMGRNEREGVVDEYGRVFGHDGLYVADGAVMPGSVGANPSLTIAAVADRFADRLIDDALRDRAQAGSSTASKD